MSARRPADKRLRRLAILGVMALALCAVVGLTLGASAEAKKKHKKHKAVPVFAATAAPNAAIPDAPPSGPSTPVRSTISVVGKAFKGKVVGDVNVTGLQATGDVTDAVNDLEFKLTAPNGRTIAVISNGIGDQFIGPLTIDDQSPVSICDSDTLICEDPSSTLIRPFAGTANELFLGNAGTGGLKAFKGVPMQGAWTMTVFDDDGIQTSTWNTWGLQITAAKPVT
jgi:subtilisin-like proprotein convertase family protein